MPVGNDSASAFAHLEQRVSYLLERIENSTDPRAGNLGRVEDGLQDILRHLENQHAAVVALAENNRNAGASQPADSGIVDMVKREMSDIRLSQSETDRRTQDSLEAVHSTLGHVVDRLAMIEGDLRTARALPVAPQPQMPPAPQPVSPQAAPPRMAMPPQPKPELPNPAAAHEHFASAPREFQAVQPPAPAVVPRTVSEILEPYTAPRPAIEPDCRPIIRSSREPAPPEGWRRRRSALPLPKARSAKFRQRAASRSAPPASSPPHAAPRRPPPPHRPRKGRPRPVQVARRRQSQGIEQGCEQGAVDHHLQDPLAAGRRERGRDRARHLQDGDDPARPGNRPADACDGEFVRAGACAPAAGAAQRQTGAAGPRARPR